MLKAMHYTLLTGACLVLGGCNTLPVTTDLNPNYSVTNCHTYAFAQEHVANIDQPAAFGNPLNADRLRSAIETNLAAKGVRRVNDHSAADCIVGYALGTRQVFSDYYGGWGVGVGYGWGYRGGWGGWGGWGWDGPYVENETRISVDLFDAKSRKAIWHAHVSQTTYDLTGPNAQARINAGTAAIFAKFPATGGPPPLGAPPAVMPPSAAPPAPPAPPATS